MSKDTVETESKYSEFLKLASKHFDFIEMGVPLSKDIITINVIKEGHGRHISINSEIMNEDPKAIIMYIESTFKSRFENLNNDKGEKAC